MSIVKKKNSVARKKNPPHPRKVDEDAKSIRFNMNLPRDLHYEFKIKCVAIGIDMTSVFVKAMEEFIKKPYK